MSKIEVNTVEPQCGTTLTVGASGDTIDTSNATLSTGGKTDLGTVNWDTTAKTAAFTAVSGKGYFVNTTSGAITVTLPASPSAGDIVAVKDYALTFATNNLTIGRNSSNINGVASNVTIDTNGASIVLVYVDGTKGWIPTQDDSSTIGALFVAATGGCITTCGNFKVHKFTGPGTFTVSCAGNAAGSNTVQYLVVGGGGGGGNSNGGGGGAGGFRMASCFTAPATAYPITVGAGGNGQPAPSAACDPAPNTGSSGSNTIFSSITSAGGGGGGSGLNTGPGNDALAGGSGGGGGTNDGCGGAGNTPPVNPSQGNSGGDGGGPGSGIPYQGGGGGGGAAACGSDVSPSPQTAGPGGAGSPAAPIFGTAPQPFYIANGPANGASACGQFAGGGGGGSGSTPSTPAGSGGVGGGANGTNSSSTGTAGTTNTGGGGGGGKNNPGGPGGNGGSGIVLIRYKFQ